MYPSTRNSSTSFGVKLLGHKMTVFEYWKRLLKELNSYLPYFSLDKVCGAPVQPIELSANALKKNLDANILFGCQDICRKNQYDTSGEPIYEVLGYLQNVQISYTFSLKAQAPSAQWNQV